MVPRSVRQVIQLKYYVRENFQSKELCNRSLFTQLWIIIIVIVIILIVLIVTSVSCSHPFNMISKPFDFKYMKLSDSFYFLKS